MAAPLLTTKYILPPDTRSLVARPHLHVKLDQILHSDALVALICAPAGYGKTTLVRSWVRDAMEHPDGAGGGSPGFAWLKVDQGENDLARFLAYLTAALQEVHPNLGNGMLAALQTPRPPDSRTLATWLINDLAQLQEGLVLVLDDLHLITSQPVHHFLSTLAEYQPQQLRLVFATRTDPPLPLARLRARRRLIEIRQHDLTFTREETAQFFSQVMGQQLTSAQVTALAARTEGWVSALQLAGLSLRSAVDVDAFITSFSGSDAHIADYLADEILAHLPAEIHAFLLETSILDRLYAPLCEAVTGRAGAQNSLEMLVEENLFVLPLDQHREWYRYHALFSDLLQKRAGETLGAEIAALHIKASRWFAENDQPVQAIDHALAGGEYDYAGALIEQIGEQILKRSEAGTLLRWLDMLPPEQQRAHPLLFVLHGLVLLFCGRPPDVARQRLDDLLSREEMTFLSGETDTFQGLLSLMQGDAQAAIRHSRSALNSLQPERDFFRSLAIDTLGMAATLQGDLSTAESAFEEVTALSEASGSPMMAVLAQSNLAGLQILQGRLRAASNSYRQALARATEHFGPGSPTTGKALLGLGLIAREWNDLDRAQMYYQEAIRKMEQAVEIGLPVAYLSLAMLAANRKDWPGAWAHLEQARRFSKQSTLTSLDDRLTEETEARLWIMQGETSLAADWARKKGYYEPVFLEALTDQTRSQLLLVNQGAYLTVARLFLADRAPVRALAILDPLCELFEGKSQLRRVIEILALQALAAFMQGRKEHAFHLLDRSLGLAEADGYVRTYLDEGETMAQLLYEAAKAGIRPVYIGKLLGAFSLEAETSANAGSTGEKVEPLSEREIEVLRLVADGLSNQEIAAHLHISLSTVKSHASHIFGKLYVNSRTQAVAAARRMGIISKS